MERLRRNIDKTLRGELSPRVALVKSARKAKTSFEVRPRVQFDNDASARATVIEIQAHDRPGLLYDITRAIFEARLFISSSCSTCAMHLATRLRTLSAWRPSKHIC